MFCHLCWAQLFKTAFATPDNMRLVTDRNEVFVACLPCCQSTKSVCHCCTTKNSTNFLPLSKKYSNCVKHSLPERLYTVLPNIHISLSIKNLASSLSNSFSASSNLFSNQHSSFSREIPSHAKMKQDLLSYPGWGFMQGPPYDLAGRSPPEGKVKTFVLGPPM